MVSLRQAAVVETEPSARWRCEKCASAMDVPYACASCGALAREPARLDHFARLGIARAFEIDRAELERRYLELSRRLHPDRQLGKDAADRTRALMLSAALNEATATLRDPERRAEYLLQLAGGPGPDKDRRTPAGFLEEALELRETVAEAKAASDRAKLASLFERMQSERDAAFARVRELFARELDARAISDLRLELNALKYVSNVVRELEDALRD